MCALEIHSTVPKATITTGRLILRSPTLSDAQRAAELADDFGVARMLARMPHPYGLAEAKSWLGSLHAGSDTGTDAVFAVEHRRHGLIGMLGIEARAVGLSLATGWAVRSGVVATPPKR